MTITHALEEKLKVTQEDLTELQSRRDLAYAFKLIHKKKLEN